MSQDVFHHSGAHLATGSWRRNIGFAVVGLGVVLTVTQVFQFLALGNESVRGALIGGMMAAGATALGTLPVALSQRFSQRAFDTMLGFGAGVMLAASAFSLVIPALAAVRSSSGGAWSASLTVGAAVVLGAASLLLIDRLVPHEHFIKGREGPEAAALRRVWLFVFAIALHNLPEGLAIGVAFAGTHHAAAQALAIGISIQDVPEGLVVAMALRSVGYTRAGAVAIGALIGLLEPVGALLGATLLTLSSGLLPWGLGAAAGAMLYVISHEIIPESHRQGHERWATGGLIAGFVLMMGLDTTLG